MWARLAAHGMVLLGHVHTHEFAVGGTTDQVGNPWSTELSAGGSSGGSAAALAARMVPAATGTDTAGSLRIPSALCGTSTIKPTRGLVSLRGVVALATSLDHAGPMARSVADCAALLAGMADVDASVPAPRGSLAGARVAVSPRVRAVELDADVAAGFDAALDLVRRLGATILPPPAGLPEAGDDFALVLLADLLAYHRRFEARRELYRPFMLEWLAAAEERSIPAAEYVRLQLRRAEIADAWADWLAAERVDAVLEPTVPVVAPPRTLGYGHAGDDTALVSLTHHWDWTGFPVVALPAGVGARSGLPVSVSLAGPPRSEWRLLELGVELQAELGIPAPPRRGEHRSSACPAP